MPRVAGYRLGTSGRAQLTGERENEQVVIGHAELPAHRSSERTAASTTPWCSQEAAPRKQTRAATVPPRPNGTNAHRE